MALTANQALPWLIDVDVFEQAVANTGWNTVNTDASALLNGYKQSANAQNDEISFDCVLAEGTWTVEIMYVTVANGGIISVQFDTVEKGTVDTYNASVTYNNRSSVAGIAVAASAKVRVKLKTATKHASSTGYAGYLQHVQLRRTA